jgi:hypothetical protein
MGKIDLGSPEQLAEVIYDAIVRHAVGAVGTFQGASVEGGRLGNETRIGANVDLLAVARHVIATVTDANGQE